MRTVPNKEMAADVVLRDEINQRLRFAAAAENTDLLAKLGTTEQGLN